MSPTESIYRTHLYYQQMIGGDQSGSPTEASMSALLADLMRLAEEYGIDFPDVLAAAGITLPEPAEGAAPVEGELECSVCGRNDVTDAVDGEPRCNRHK